jgi:solute carrier family 25 phosphate transporter 3
MDSKLSKLFPSPVSCSQPKRNLSAAAGAETYSCEFGSGTYYAYCGLGGLLSCGITHTMVTPLDLVKCRLQVNKEKYKSLGNGFKVTLQEGGPKNLFLGWGPTAIGYSLQGICKFGFYEVFKNIYSGLLGEENSYLYRTSLYLVSQGYNDNKIELYYHKILPTFPGCLSIC